LGRRGAADDGQLMP